MHLLKLKQVAFHLQQILGQLGPAFQQWLVAKKNTRVDWLDEIDKVNFIYISHNHPDHLHPLTLSKK